MNDVPRVFHGGGFPTTTALASVGLTVIILILRADVLEGLHIGGLVVYCAGGVFLLQSDILVLKHTVMSVFDISYKYTKKRRDLVRSLKIIP